MRCFILHQPMHRRGNFRSWSNSASAVTARTCRAPSPCAAIAESIDDQMVGELTRSMVEAVSVPGITFQQQEHAILLNVHAALHKVLAAARQAPQALAEAEEAAAAAAAATSTAAGTS